MDKTYSEAYPELYRRHWWWRAREVILLRQLSSLLEGSHRERPARILDVGCGAGLFFDALQRFGEVEGIESDHTAAERSGTWRSRIHVGRLDSSFVPTAPYDAILMLDVLEHLDRPEEVLRRSATMLAPGGFALITVPAFDWLWTRHDDLNHHLRRYTAASMKGTVEAAGLIVARSRYLFQSLVIPKILVRLRESMSRLPAAPPTIPGDVLNSALQRWLLAEYALARWLPVGTSLMVVATCPQANVRAR